MEPQRDTESTEEDHGRSEKTNGTSVSLWSNRTGRVARPEVRFPPRSSLGVCATTARAAASGRRLNHKAHEGHKEENLSKAVARSSLVLFVCLVVLSPDPLTSGWPLLASPPGSSGRRWASGRRRARRRPPRFASPAPRLWPLARGGRAAAVALRRTACRRGPSLPRCRRCTRAAGRRAP